MDGFIDLLQAIGFDEITIAAILALFGYVAYWIRKKRNA